MPTPSAKRTLPFTLDEAILDIDRRAADILFMIGQHPGRLVATHANHVDLSAVECAVADLRSALRERRI